jgi:hypothetical protein
VNLNTVLEWVKSNIFIVVFVVLMIAAPVGMYIVTSGMNEEVRKEVSERAQKTAELTRLENSTIELNGQQVPALVNDAFLAQYRQFADRMGGDAKQVQEAALAHNRKAHGLLMEGVFPEMPEHVREVRPQHFHEALMSAYERLLGDVKAGTPPTLESLRDELDLRRRQFITQDLKKSTEEKLEPEEQKRLAEELSNLRMAKYTETARNVGVYLSLDALNVPGFDRTNPPTIGEMFSWQWQYWVIDDVLHALQQVNNKDQSVATAPVKHVRLIDVRNVPAGAESQESSDGGGGAGAGGSAGAFGGDGGGSGGDPSMASEGDGSAPMPMGGAPADPRAMAPLDYRASLTGRVTNPLYDVINVDLELVVETERLPQIIDAISSYNFMTVTSMNLSPADPFAAAGDGFFYGTKPVSTVNMTIETIWLRAWTKESMPKSIKQQLKIADQPVVPNPEEAPTT